MDTIYILCIQLFNNALFSLQARRDCTQLGQLFQVPPAPSHSFWLVGESCREGCLSNKCMSQSYMSTLQQRTLFPSGKTGLYTARAVISSATSSQAFLNPQTSQALPTKRCFQAFWGMPCCKNSRNLAVMAGKRRTACSKSSLVEESRDGRNCNAEHSWM